MKPAIDVARRVGTSLIAQGFSREHKTILELVNRYRSDFEEFGPLPKSKLSTKGRPVVEYSLDYNQMLLLLSYMRTTAEMRSLRVQLVKTGTLAKAVELLRNFESDGCPTRYVYAVVDGFGNVKIGITRDIDARVKSLQVANSTELRLVMYREAVGSGYSDEVRLHKECAGRHLRGEWFSSDALELIDQ